LQGGAGHHDLSPDVKIPVAMKLRATNFSISSG